MAGLPGGAVAQYGTPSAVGTAHPAHIHSGSCDMLGDVVFPLEDATVQPPATPVASNASGAESAAAASTTTVEASLDDILAAEHAINVHESTENIGNYIACGDIVGEPADGMLEIDLEELNGAGYSGTASLIDNGDGTTTVTIALTLDVSVGTPAAEASASSVTVEIAGLAFSPAVVTIPVGGSITWVNTDSAPHTATGLDRDVLQSGTLNQGESFTQTFDTPGTYEYFCEFHANMNGTIIVE
jgi:plastocyanin